MTCDPFPGRCRRCGTALMETDADDCGRGRGCRTTGEFWRDVLAGVRDTAAGAARGVLRAVRSVVDE